MFMRFFRNLKRSISWFFFMWNNQEWDYNYFYIVMQKKLKSMLQVIENGDAVTRKSVGRMMKLALYHLERIIEADTCNDLYDQHEKKYGELKSMIQPCKDKRLNQIKFYYDKDNDHASKVSLRIFKIENYRMEKHKEKFFNILNRWVQYWWD